MIGTYINEYIRERIGVKKNERIRQEVWSFICRKR
jgi:hypothetical protein